MCIELNWTVLNLKNSLLIKSELSFNMYINKTPSLNLVKKKKNQNEKHMVVKQNINIDKLIDELTFCSKGDHDVSCALVDTGEFQRSDFFPDLQGFL